MNSFTAEVKLKLIYEECADWQKSKRNPMYKTG
jgi:hypothetical protein